MGESLVEKCELYKKAVAFSTAVNTNRKPLDVPCSSLFV